MDVFWDNVKKLIKKEIKSFENKNNVEQICQLRDFAFRHIPFALSPETHLDYENICDGTKNAKENAGRLFSIETICRGGFYCDGCAYSLMELYSALGYEAEFLAMGTDLVNSHCVTLVKLLGDGEWYVQDPTFNQTVYDRQGNLMSLKRMLSLLIERKHDEIVMRGGVSMWQQYGQC